VAEAITYASTFAGIEGFGQGFDRAGMRCVFQSEINPYRLQVLNNHYPNVRKAGDIRDVSGSDLGRPDILVAGFPCKDLSIGKGKRTGLDGERSGLYWEFQRLVDEHLRLVDATRPRWCVLENVPGLVNYAPRDGGRPTKASNDGRDMAAVVLGLEELGYGWAYRVVDSRDFGSAQRRPRVVLVAHRGGDPRPAWLVLADREDGQQSPDVRGEPTGEECAVGARSLVPDGARFVRKSARPTAKATEGGFSTWVEADFFNVLTPNDGLNVNEKTGTATLAPQKQTHFVHQDGRLRVLTPLEWERLQGCPDGWTEGIPDEERLYALGDAMNVNMSTWLGYRLRQVHEALPLLPERLAS
jgi:DNA (cytosine-5)-methyltransferase 1